MDLDGWVGVEGGQEAKPVQKSIFFFFWPPHLACRILVPQPGIEPEPPAVKAWNVNH